MAQKKFPWTENTESDPVLNFDYQLEKLTKSISFLQSPWLHSMHQPRVMVTGADGWLGHYLLHMLTAGIGPAEILATGEKEPEYLSASRYNQVEYRCAKENLAATIKDFSPHLIFHCDYLWHVHYRPAAVYEKNVYHSEIIYAAAVQTGVARIITFSDGILYGAGTELAAEDAIPSPKLALAKSFAFNERIAGEYHLSGKTEIYHLRSPFLYGPEIPVGIMSLAYLMQQGILFGPLQKIEQITMVSGYHLALSGFLLAMAHKIKYRVFNIAGEDISMKSLLGHLSRWTARNKILGFNSRPAHIMKIGYQEQMTMPKSLLDFLGSLYQNSTEFLNQMRFAVKNPIITRAMVEYIYQGRVISGKRLTDTLGWKGEGQVGLEHGVQNIETRGQEIFRISPDFIGKEKIQEKSAFLDSIIEIVEDLYQYVPGVTAGDKKYKLPLLPCEIDIKSLWILVEKVWARMLMSLGSTKSSQKLSLIWPEWSWWIGRKILALIRYEQNRARELFPDDLPSQVKHLSIEIGRLHPKRLRFYATVASLSGLIEKLDQWQKEHRALLQIVPEKNYGIFLADERGDVGIVFQVKNNQIKFIFPRKQIESISQTEYLGKRLIEFKKNARLHIALGTRLDNFLADMSSGLIGQKIIRGLGKDYLLTEESDYYHLIGRSMHESTRNMYLFVDEQEQVSFGIKLQGGGRFTLLSPSKLEMINTLLKQWQNREEIIELINNVGEGKDQPVFVEITTVRRLLAGLISPSILHKILFSIMGKSVENKVKQESKNKNGNGKK